MWRQKTSFCRTWATRSNDSTSQWWSPPAQSSRPFIPLRKTYRPCGPLGLVQSLCQHQCKQSGPVIPTWSSSTCTYTQWMLLEAKSYSPCLASLLQIRPHGDHSIMHSQAGRSKDCVRLHWPENRVMQCLHSQPDKYSSDPARWHRRNLRIRRTSRTWLPEPPRTHGTALCA